MLKRIFIAGAYNASNIINALDNMRRGQQLAYNVIKAGYSPFCPFFDYHFSLIGPMTIEEYYKYSCNFLEICDAVIVVNEGYEHSVGTQKELEIARSLGIPIFFKLDDLIEHDVIMSTIKDIPKSI